MEMVRGLRARMRYNGKVITKAGIIRLLKSEVYGLSDWMARQVYADSVNFFYSQETYARRLLPTSMPKNWRSGPIPCS